MSSFKYPVDIFTDLDDKNTLLFTAIKRVRLGYIRTKQAVEKNI